jgi:hypothetical protein
LIAVGVRSGGTSRLDHALLETGEFSIWLEGWENLERGVIIASAPVRAKFKMEAKLSVYIAFDDVEGIKGEPVVAVLNQMADLVERIVGIFERRFFR